MDNKYIYFNSVSCALFENILKGNTTIQDVLEHGNFGIGTLNSLDGELIIIDNKSYSIRGDGIANEVSLIEKTPLTIITKFSKNIEIYKENLNYNEFQKVINDNLPSQNLLYAIKVQGIFTNTKLRGIDKQKEPYRLFTEIIKEGITYNYDMFEGHLVGFKVPDYLNNISVPGFHFHCIDYNFQNGGHLFYSDFKKIKIEIGIYHNFKIELNNTKEFYNTVLGDVKNEKLNNILKNEFYND